MPSLRWPEAPCLCTAHVGGVAVRWQVPEACVRRSSLLPLRTPDRWLGLSSRPTGIVPEANGVTHETSSQRGHTHIRSDPCVPYDRRERADAGAPRLYRQSGRDG
jgi:hypothetical protein